MARQPRSDAVRNRGRILAAAREQITQHGPEIGMDAIATSAGVAVGTLYRHFPTKEALVMSVIQEVMERLADRAEESASRTLEGAPADDILASFVRTLIAAAADNHAVKAAAAALGASSVNTAAEERVSAAVATMIEVGSRAGVIPSDVTVTDIYLLVMTAPSSQPSAARERWLDLMLGGLMVKRRPNSQPLSPADGRAQG